MEKGIDVVPHICWPKEDTRFTAETDEIGIVVFGMGGVRWYYDIYETKENEKRVIVWKGRSLQVHMSIERFLKTFDSDGELYKTLYKMQQ